MRCRHPARQVVDQPIVDELDYAVAGKTCADSDDHIGLDESVYWYRWEPAQAPKKKFPSTMHPSPCRSVICPRTSRNVL